MSYYIQLDIELIDDMIMGDFSGQDELSASLSYIAGSTIRGAVIYGLLSEGIIDRESILDSIVANKIYFLNAYKLEGDRRAIPTPLCFYSDKVKQRTEAENTEVYNVLKQRSGAVDEQWVRVKRMNLY